MIAAPQSLGTDSPSGDNLEYEQVFTDLELAATFEEERQSGNEVIPGQDPDPSLVAARAEAVLEQSHDLRAAVLLAYAETRMNALPGLAGATSYIRACLEDFWDSCHPQLDHDDGDDPTMRVNAILGLVDPRRTLRAVRMAPLTDSAGFGRMSLRDIEIADGEVQAPGAENPPDAARVAAAFRDTPEATLVQTYDAARSALADVQAIDTIFNDRTPGLGPRLDALLQVLRKAVKRLASEVPNAEPEPEADAIAEGAAAAPAQRAASGVISDRADVERAIDGILAYYSRHEPSSPVPILLARAKKLVGADFMTIVKEMAPGGADNVKLIGGLE